MSEEQDRQPDPRASVFDAMAARYDQHMEVTGHTVTASQLLRRALAFVGSVRRVLELACGTGFATEILLNELPRSNVVAVDISQEMLGIARARLRNDLRAAFVQADLEQLDAEQYLGAFDLAAVVYGICWFELEAVVNLLDKALGDTGKILIIDDVCLPQPIFSQRFPHLADTIAGARTFKSEAEITAAFASGGFSLKWRAQDAVADTHESYAILLQRQ